MLKHHFLMFIARTLKQCVIRVHSPTHICVCVCVCVCMRARAYRHMCVKELYISHLICVLQGNIVVGHCIKKISHMCIQCSVHATTMKLGYLFFGFTRQVCWYP